MDYINGKTEKLGLIGKPVSHSMSPKIQNQFCAHFGFNGVYCGFESDFSILKNTVESFKMLNFKGFNITYPFKEEIIKYLDEIDETSRILNAVNTVKIVNGKLFGYNTDVYGFEMLLEHNKIDVSGKTVGILGTGGAARAVAIALFNRNAASIKFFTRNKNKSFKLGEEKIDSIIEFLHYDQYDSVQNQLFAVINATPLGMGDMKEHSPINSKEFSGLEAAIDLIYNPPKTVFLQNAGKTGVKGINGFQMLFFQGLKSFEIWTGIDTTEYGIILRKNTLFEGSYEI